MTNWIKTADALPEYGERVLLSIPGRALDIGALCIDQEDGAKYWMNIFGDWTWVCSDATHWMEIPALPEEENK